jgi:hypothetical protein
VLLRQPSSLAPVSPSWNPRFVSVVQRRDQSLLVDRAAPSVGGFLGKKLSAACGNLASSGPAKKSFCGYSKNKYTGALMNGCELRPIGGKMLIIKING